MIADQQTGKNSRPALATTEIELPLFRYFAVQHLFLPIFKDIPKRRNYQIMGKANCRISNCSTQWTTVKIAVAKQRNCGLEAVAATTEKRAVAK
jgi:hypothetical protein